MNFFEQQDHARRQTKTLIILFVLAVIAIVAAVNLVAALIWTWGHASIDESLYPRGFFLANTLITVGLIAGGTLVEIYNLRDGGEAVAQMAGGRAVSPATSDLHERRLLNVVEEMALASGIACPKVYLLEREESINAFAAGYNPNEAVVAVTRGTLLRLTRDELQGVIGHEFSHILNGDMRLNVRLIGVLFGIQSVASFGQHLLDFSARSGGGRSSDEKGPSLQMVMLVLGIALLVIGYIGVIFGRLIKSAVSRQREFLADASAIQFTRNPDGIGNALRKIGGLSRQHPGAAKIRHPNAEQLSHLFLSAVKPSLLSGMFATHPPIAERLRRIFGRNVDLLNAPELRGEYAAPEMLPDIPYVASGFASDAGFPTPAAALRSSTANVDTAAPGDAQAIAFGRHVVQQAQLAPELNSALRDPQAACAVVFALLYEADTPANLQDDILQQHVPEQAALVVYLASTIAKLPPAARLPLLDLAMPALRQLSQFARDQLLAVVNHLIAADRRMTLAEFVLETVLARRLAAHAGRAVPVKFADLTPLRQDCALILSLIAHVAQMPAHAAAQSAPPTREAATQAFQRGAALCPQLHLGEADLVRVADMGFAAIKSALDRCNQLAPLAKPALIKALVAATLPAAEMPLPIHSADVLRAICAALEAPLPPAVTAAYSECDWGPE